MKRKEKKRLARAIVDIVDVLGLSRIIWTIVSLVILGRCS